MGMQNHNEALNSYLKCIELSENNTLTKPTLSKLNLKTAQSYKYLNNEEATDSYLSKALELREMIKDEYSRMLLDFDVAKTFWIIGEKEKAQEIFKNILPQLEKRDARLLIRQLEELKNE